MRFISVFRRCFNGKSQLGFRFSLALEQLKVLQVIISSVIVEKRLRANRIRAVVVAEQ